jgi:hypothetical protein
VFHRSFLPVPAPSAAIRRAVESCESYRDIGKCRFGMPWGQPLPVRRPRRRHFLSP